MHTLDILHIALISLSTQYENISARMSTGRERAGWRRFLSRAVCALEQLVGREGLDFVLARRVRRHAQRPLERPEHVGISRRVIEGSIAFRCELVAVY